jgi:transcriptional regulator with XRE-family HTH domain
MNKQRKVDGEKLRRARGLLTLSEVGKTIGVTRQQVWSYENGKSLPSIEKMLLLLDLYNVKLENVLMPKS